MPSKESIQPAKEFAKDNWPKILGVTGGALAGATILLLIKYHKHVRDKRNSERDENDLNQAEDEALMEIDETSKILDVGQFAADTIPNSGELAETLANSLDELSEDPEEPDETKKKAGSIMKILARLGRKQ